MDIFALLDQLEHLANGSRRMRFTNKVLIDEDELLEIVDQLRTAVPDEIRQSKKTLTERERIISTAQAEADRLKEAAEQEVGRIINDEKLVEEARKQADQILRDAEARAQSVTSGADEYAAHVLKGLEQMLSTQLGTVRNGLIQLEQEASRPSAQI